MTHYKSKLSNELECRGIYRMTYDAYIQRYIGHRDAI